MTKQQAQKRAIINIEYKVVEPWVHAGALASSCAAFAVPFGAPVVSWACIGGGSAFFVWWVKNTWTRPKRKKAATGRVGANIVTVNSVNGSRRVRVDGGSFEYAPGYVSRETFWEIGQRLVRGKPKPKVTSPSPTKPRWMAEFVFYGQYQGKEVQLLESDVSRFLNAAWRAEKRHKKGTGLSQRRWGRNIAQRPQWYKNLGIAWYYALIDLLWEVEEMSGRQLVIPVGHQQNALARDPHQTLDALRWAQAERGNVKAGVGAEELIIGTEGASSFEG